MNAETEPEHDLTALPPDLEAPNSADLDPLQDRYASDENRALHKVPEPAELDRITKERHLAELAAARVAVAKGEVRVGDEVFDARVQPKPPLKSPLNYAESDDPETESA